jgi:hypothetical protein
MWLGLAKAELGVNDTQRIARSPALALERLILKKTSCLSSFQVSSAPTQGYNPQGSRNVRIRQSEA